MINNQHVDLVHGSQGGINVSPCWSHPCSVQNATAASPCGLMGNCRPIMNDYSCECPLGKLAIEPHYKSTVSTSKIHVKCVDYCSVKNATAASPCGLMGTC